MGVYSSILMLPFYEQNEVFALKKKNLIRPNLINKIVDPHLGAHFFSLFLQVFFLCSHVLP